MIVCVNQTRVTVGSRDLRMQRYEKVEKIGEGVCAPFGYWNLPTVWVVR